MNILTLRMTLGLLFAITTAGPMHAGYSAATEPSPAQIYLIAARNLGEARQMTQDVLRRHPESAVAHWVAAVLDVRAANLLVASRELATAEQLAPGLPFASPDAVVDLQRQLQRTARAGSPVEVHVAKLDANTP
ncbi:MAG: hypothetical protein ACYDAE_23510 [Steroidobacteraceae bacterium]